MNAELWSRVERITAEAIALPESEQEPYASRQCGTEPEVLNAVLELLEAGRKMGGDYLESPALDFTRERFGQYRALREIGRGGMSVVYLGARAGGEFERQAAIKILLTGGAITQDETRILASLEHANIARLFDAGTSASGFRYLVMELVEGQRIEKYCRGLSEERRLRLFLQICAGVEYANRCLIVHRDLKPANILVTQQGVVKLLDFGIAKMLSPEPGADHTTGARAWTPDYASPEQILGLPVTTSTDVYSLGVLLCELIGGGRPRAFAGLPLAEVVERAAHEEIQQVPLTGDLALVARKALRRDPGVRYASAAELARDIERYLEGRPVEARAPSWSYRAGKFISRNRYRVAAGALAVAALIVTTGIAIWQARVASERFYQVRGLARSVLFELHDAIKPLPDSLAARQLLVRRSLDYLDTLARDTRATPGMQLELVNGYLRLADIEGTTGQASLGNTGAALSHLAKAVAIARRLTAARPDDREAAKSLTGALRLTSTTFTLRGEGEKAIQAAAEALRIAERLRAASPSDRQVALEFAEALHTMATAYSRSRTGLARSLPVLRKLTEVRRELLSANPGGENERRHLSRALQQTVVALYTQGDFQAADLAAQESYRINQARLKAGNEGAILQLATDIGYLANFAWKRQDYRAAVPLLEEQLRLRMIMAAKDSRDAHMARRVGASMSRLGFTYAKIGRLPEAIRVGSDALARQRKVYAGDPANNENARELFFALLDLAETYHVARRNDLACPLAREADRFLALLLKKSAPMEKDPPGRLRVLLNTCGS